MSALGASAPKTMPDPDRWNPRGYFECARLFVLLDEMLASAESSWDDWQELDQNWFSSESAKWYRQKIKDLLIDEFDDAPLIVIKDGRICRFVPFISSILMTAGFDTVAVLPIRSPLEVALSLRERDGFELSKSLLLWARHVLDAEFYSRPMQRCLVPYEGLIADWRRHLDRVTEKTGIVWRSRSESSAAKIDEFLTTDLHRKLASAEEAAEYPEIVDGFLHIFEMLMNIVTHGEDVTLLEQLDRERIVFNQACDALGIVTPTEEWAAIQINVLRGGAAVPRIADA